MLRISLLSLSLMALSACLDTASEKKDPLKTVASDCRKEVETYFRSVCQGIEGHSVCTQFKQLFAYFQLPNDKPICQPRIFSRMLLGQNRRWAEIVARKVEKDEDIPANMKQEFMLNLMDAFVGEVLGGAKVKSGLEKEALAMQDAYRPYRGDAPDSHVEAHRAQEERLIKKIKTH